MNVLILANELRYTCGVTNHLLHLTRGLAENKDVNLWLICGGGNGIGRFKDINIQVLKDNRFFHDERNLRSYTSAIVFLTKLVYKNKINIIHSHSHYTANIARHASKLTGVKTIQTNHGLLEHTGKLKHFNAKKYVAINEHIYDHLIQNKAASGSNISFIRCGVPVPEDIPHKDVSRLKVIAASRFTHDKGLDLFIKAVSTLEHDIKSKADFIIAGDGELKEELMKLNKELGADISFPGSVKNMYKLLSGCHILVYPSRSGTEGFPAIITEAGANGLLIITSDFTGVRDVVQNNIDGAIFKSDNHTELAKRLSAAIENFDMFKPMAENFYNKVKDWYSVDKMITEHMELYRSCL